MTERTVRFYDILKDLADAQLEPFIVRPPSNTDHLFDAVSTNPSSLSPSTLFCAIKGTKHDGHNALRSLDRASVKLAIVERDSEEFAQLDCAVIRVKSTRAAWAQLASFFAGHPTKSLTMIGVTGTNGKTSTVWLMKGILEALGIRTGTIGTLGFYIGTTHMESSHTTPDPDVLYPQLANMINHGVSHVIMEVSSHSLVQDKLWPILFTGTIFTSFSQDHLDFHHDMKSYLLAKLQLFLKYTSKTGVSVIHEDVQSSELFHENTPKNFDQCVLSYGRSSAKAAFVLTSTSNYLSGTSQIIISSSKNSDAAQILAPVVGDVFCENFAAALVLASKLLGNSIADFASPLSVAKLEPVPGRLQFVSTTGCVWRPKAYVDYAHTPDALAKAITSLSREPNSVTTIFGCGGERDSLKRPLMGRVASDLSKSVTITSDNPRSESPEKIVREILAGTNPGATLKVELDRKTAIESTVHRLGAMDVLLLAGKGHETYQLINSEKIPFDDSKVLAAALKKPQRWLVFGGGISGEAAARYLLRHNELVTISDDHADRLSPNSPIGKTIKFDDIQWDAIDKVVVSPGVPTDHKVYAAARAFHIEVLSEIDIGLELFLGRVIAITGTNGKSTTVSLTQHLLQNTSTPAVACGNIGLPPSALDLDSNTGELVAVVELSSYQLETSFPKPSNAVAITSFSPDHLARHKSLQKYFEAKWKVTSWLKPGALLILTDDVVKYALQFNVSWPSDARIVVLGFGKHESSNLPPDSTRLDLGRSVVQLGGWSLDFDAKHIRGHHNRVNAVASLLLANAVSQTSLESLEGHLATFQALAFRCQEIFRSTSRCIINDSKSTNLESTLAALSSMSRPVILIMGGQGKGESYDPLKDHAHYVLELVTFGASGNEIARAVDGIIPTKSFRTMQEATQYALQTAKLQDCDLVFSPGCASFDEFKNFEARGELFSSLVKEFETSVKI